MTGSSSGAAAANAASTPSSSSPRASSSGESPPPDVSTLTASGGDENGSAPGDSGGAYDAERPPWSQEAEDVRTALGTPEEGLAEAEAHRRRETYGPNRMHVPDSVSLIEIVIRQLRSLVVLILAGAAVVAFAMGDTVEAAAVGVVLLINTVIGTVMEWRAVRSMEALRSLDEITCTVVRGGIAKVISAEELVPGDLVRLEEGDLVPADLRLIDGAQLRVSEAALTGESAPVSKITEPIDADTVLAERANMAFKGTSVATGSARGVVTATGMQTEVGEISDLVAASDGERTPLEERLDQLGKSLIGAVLLVTVLVAATGIGSGRSMKQMIETAVALAVAAIPEGLPVVATIALARGLRRMARRSAMVRRLSSVETLGATSVICTDKTGTLTENEMRVVRWLQPETSGAPGAATDPREAPAATAVPAALAALCTSATLSVTDNGDTATGDPMEVALLHAAVQAGFDLTDLRDAWPEIGRHAFSRDTRQMATIHRLLDRAAPASSGPAPASIVIVKGAPEAVLAGCTHILNGPLPPAGDLQSLAQSFDSTFSDTVPLTDEQRQTWVAENDGFGEEGLRVLALAARRLPDGAELHMDESPYHDLTFLGLIGLLDPPREDVRGMIESCRHAGIRVMMVTGDQPATARAVARAIGLVEDGDAAVIHGRDVDAIMERDGFPDAVIFARVSPRQKLDLVDALQAEGVVVAMTGDGVNDAPALQRADIGVAMGQRGTQVAQDASDIVLLDDAFGTILVAVEEGRTIFRNIRAFVRYLLACNVAEVMVVGIATLGGMPLPLLPLQILFLNLVTDVFPALALGMSEAEEDVLEHPPRPADEPILTRAHWTEIVGYSGVIAGTVLGALLVAVHSLDYAASEAVTISFLTLAVAQLVHVFNMRSCGTSFVQNAVTHNPHVWAAVALCVGILLVAVFVPPVASVLSLAPPTTAGWVLVLLASTIPVLAAGVLRCALFGRTDGG